jgi:atypical dual specificity phosphatase
MSRLKARTLFWPTLAWNVLLGRILRRRHWWDEIEPGVLLGAMPLGSDPARLARLGVHGVVNMCEEYRGPVEFYRDHGIEQLWLPTVDFTPPTLDDIHRGVAFIDRQLDQGQSVYVHCKAGRGRSGTVVLCWLMQARGLSAQEAQQRLIERRPHVKHDLYERTVVGQFAAELARRATA